MEFDIECMVASVEDEEEEEEEEDLLADRSNSARSNRGGATTGGQSWGDDEYSSRHASSNDIFAQDQQAQSQAQSSHPQNHGHHHHHQQSHSHGGGEKLEKGSIAHLSAEKRSSSLWAPEHRRPLLIGFGLQLVQQFSGINAVFFYSTAFFTSAHMSDPWLGSVLASSVNVLATGLSIYLIERMGRRKLLLISTMGMMLSCVGLTYALQAMAPHAAAASSGSYSIASAAPPAWVSFFFNST